MGFFNIDLFIDTDDVQRREDSSVVPLFILNPRYRSTTTSTSSNQREAVDFITTMKTVRLLFDMTSNFELKSMTHLFRLNNLFNQHRGC